MEPLELTLIGLVIALGIIGVLIPVLPGLLLALGGVLVWALVERTALAWAILGVSIALVAVSQVVKYLIPGQRMRSAGVPMRSIVAGGLLAIIGFFVIPIVGVVIGFVLGIYLAERVRLHRHRPAWESTVHALKAVGLSILIELATGLLIGAAWLAAVVWG